MTKLQIKNNLSVTFNDLSSGSFFIYNEKLYFKLDAEKNGDFSYNAVNINGHITCYFDDSRIVTEIKDVVFNY